MRGTKRFAAVAVVLGLCAAALVGTAASSPPSTSVTGTIKVVVSVAQQRSWNVLIPNFQRVYPNVTVTPTFVSGGSVGQNALLVPQLQAGTGPDVMIVYPGTGVEPSVSTFSNAGYAKDMSKRPWVKRDPAWIRDMTNVN